MKNPLKINPKPSFRFFVPTGFLDRQLSTAHCLLRSVYFNLELSGFFGSPFRSKFSGKIELCHGWITAVIVGHISRMKPFKRKANEKEMKFISYFFKHAIRLSLRVIGEVPLVYWRFT